MPADAVMPISVVVERRAAEGPWRDDLWRPIGVLPGSVAAERGRLLAEGDGWAQYQGGVLELELFRRETEGYLANLTQDPPRVFVVLRRNEGAAGLDFEPFMATVCPYEAMNYNEHNDDVVEGVAMPPAVMAWLRDFVAQHHVDVPFKKRKNRRYDDDDGGRPPARAGQDRGGP